MVPELKAVAVAAEDGVEVPSSGDSAPIGAAAADDMKAHSAPIASALSLRGAANVHQSPSYFAVLAACSHLRQLDALRIDAGQRQLARRIARRAAFESKMNRCVKVHAIHCFFQYCI